MNDGQLTTIVTEIGTIHYPQSNPDQLRELKQRLSPYHERDVRDTLKHYARNHEFLSVEKFAHAVSEVARTRDTSHITARREAIEREARQIREHVGRIDAIVEGLSDEEFAAIVDEIRQEEDGAYPECVFRRGRQSPALRLMVSARISQREVAA